MELNDWTLRVRMYRQGIGDCFLITAKEGEIEHHILVDCGVLKGTQGAAEKMRRIVDNIREASGGGLDLLVCTHEHWDHLSSFSAGQAQDLWDRIEIKRIWMGWTEDPGDKQAGELRKRFDSMNLAMQLAIDSAALKDSRDIVMPVLAFLGYDGGDMPFQFAQGTRDALNYLHGRTQTTELSYCEPGQVRKIDGLGGVRFFILGPPRDETLLQRDRPRKGKNETFEFALASSISGFFLDAPDLDRLRDAYPFSDKFHLKPDTDAVQAFLKNTGYDPSDWRGINPDLALSATELALQMDSDTNNTSLAFAIEMVDSGRVLLFPGDAQVGNWQSWQSVRWEGFKDLTSRQLLERTVFYKVAHHGSHNATPKEGGLELMTHPDLVAMLPTDEAFALTRGVKGWKMPAEAMYKALMAQTRGRIIRADHGVPVTRPEALNQADWVRFQESASGENPLFADYFLR